jgi:undecaprenyl-diphosphatase
MNLFQALILGIVQGATEYIPVSSSAHLVLVPWLLGWPDASFGFEVLVQWGTLVGVLVFFWQDVWVITKGVLYGLQQRRPLATFEAKLGWLILVATLPAIILGTLLKDFFEAAFAEPAIAGVLLILTAALLIIAERYGSRLRTLESLNWLDAIIIGIWQALAILPGISRSGATISGAVLRGFSRPAAARFSFLMSIPALLGAGVVALTDLLQAGSLSAELPAISVGFIAAAISGYACIRWLLHYLQRHSLYIFAAYCTVFSIISIVVAVVRG